MNKLFSIARRFLTDKEARFGYLNEIGAFRKMEDEKFLRKAFEAKLGYPLDLEDPKTFNEKLQWLKLYNRRPEYTVMVDKVKVREWVAGKIGTEFLIPSLGVWDDPDDIDFDALPDQFVLKCNHNSGMGMCICKDKSKLDIPKVKEELRKGLVQDYYQTAREWPYKDVSRKILGEQFIKDPSGDLKDYKFYCFHGKVKALMIATGRFLEGETYFDYFDRNYQVLPFTWGNPNSKIPPSKPELLSEMVAAAEKLAEGIPHVRVDLYETGGSIYFGEMTFFDGSGFTPIEPREWDLKLGEWLKLPENTSYES